MANLPETPQWEEGIYQIEVSDPVLGGPDGISNRQGKQLASRTLYLKQQVEKGGSELAKHIAAADPHTQYAPKASPTFTGTPTAPTPANSDNSKKLATTEFVAKALAALAGSAPETLDTLKELADALGNDPNFATTVLNKLAEKLAKDQHGADIPDPALFVKNLGLAEAGNTSGKLALIGNTKTDNDKCAVIVKTGSNANGKYRIWSDGSIDMWGNGIANVNGDALVNYPIALPAAAQNITTTPAALSTGTNRPITSVMVVTDLTTATKATFIVKRSDGTTSADGFYWSVNYAAF
ncbi:gp53-like domain-containing protein [Citrobacter farmeri]|uniref:gp53-like domain-containing protein n=1 Tax=Citrobacter farmeri TaxID=67824 RepID=UPI001F0AEC2B|nr:phage tail protein [Citrobacter farmeri]